MPEPENHQWWWDVDLDEILKKAKVGDSITYLTDNQEGTIHYKVIKNKNGKKDIEEIGDYLGYFNDPNHPDYYFYNDDASGIKKQKKKK